jgi:hypothetical protein
MTYRIHSEDMLEVILSERNLLTLLAKVRRPDTKATLVKLTPDGATLMVRGETDAVHYGERDMQCPTTPKH